MRTSVRATTRRSSLPAAPLALAVAAVLATAPAARAQTEPLEFGAFAFEKTTTVPIGRVDAFDAFTGDVLPWWDHSHSEHPKAIVMEPKFGGSFYEVFDDEGNGAKHAEVLYSHRGELLILHGPLGLVGNALDLVCRISFEEAEAGSTLVRVKAKAAGQKDPEWETILPAVWEHFLGRYHDWVVSGRWAESRK